MKSSEVLLHCILDRPIEWTVKPVSLWSPSYPYMLELVYVASSDSVWVWHFHDWNLSIVVLNLRQHMLIYLLQCLLH